MDKDKEVMEKVGARPDGPGSREPSPTVSAASGFDPSREERPWPLCGYAPGAYHGRCHQCGREFEGDKRAMECLECAAVSAKFLIQRAGRVRKMAIELHDNILLWSEFGGPKLPPLVEKALCAMFDALRDSDRSGEAGETGTGSTEGESAGPQGHRPPLSTERTPHV